MQRVDATDHQARTNQRLPNRSVFLFKVNSVGGHRLRHSICCGRLVAEQRLAFSFTSLLSISLLGMVRSTGFGQSNKSNSSHTPLSAGCFIQHSTVERELFAAADN